MELDAFLTGLDVAAAAGVARTLEASTFHGLWLAETRTDPFLAFAAAATATTRLRLGTGITVAFPRSPMVTAMDAWALAKATGGRFDLGLGTQVRAHVERRFSTTFDRPVARMREYVAALRHIWGAFQHEHRLAFRGDFYRFDLMSPFFDPGPIEHPRIAVHLAAVNRRMYRLAGEVADGIVGHPFSTPRYLREVALPAVGRGLATSGRAREAFSFVCPVFTVVESGPAVARDEAYAREQLAFYASTPAYRPVLEHHGWGALGEELSALARQGRFDELPALVTAEVFDAFVTRAPDHGALGAALRRRYGGVVDRIGLYGDPTRLQPDRVRALAAAL